MTLFLIRIEDFIDNERIYIMELILAHHEIHFELIRYGLVLIGAGWVCFKWLFPMIGQWCCNLCKKLEDANKRMEQEREKMLDPHSVSWEDLKKREAQRKADDKCVIDGLYMDENEIEECHDSIEHI